MEVEVAASRLEAEMEEGEEPEEGEIPDDGTSSSPSFQQDDQTSEAIIIISQLLSYSVTPSQLLKAGIDPAFLSPALEYLGHPPLYLHLASPSPSHSFPLPPPPAPASLPPPPPVHYQPPVPQQDWDQIERMKRDELRRRKDDLIKRNQSSARELERDIEKMFSAVAPAVPNPTLHIPPTPSTSTTSASTSLFPLVPPPFLPPINTNFRRPTASDLISDPPPLSSTHPSLIIDLESSDEEDDEESSGDEDELEEPSSDDELEAKQVLLQLGLASTRPVAAPPPPLVATETSRPPTRRSSLTPSQPLPPAQPRRTSIPTPTSLPPLPTSLPPASTSLVSSRPIRSLPPSRQSSLHPPLASSSHPPTPSLLPTAPVTPTTSTPTTSTSGIEGAAKKLLSEKEEEIRRVMAKIQEMESKAKKSSSGDTGAGSGGKKVGTEKKEKGKGKAVETTSPPLVTSNTKPETEVSKMDLDETTLTPSLNVSPPTTLPSSVSPPLPSSLTSNPRLPTSVPLVQSTSSSGQTVISVSSEGESMQIDDEEEDKEDQEVEEEEDGIKIEITEDSSILDVETSKLDEPRNELEDSSGGPMEVTEKLDSAETQLPVTDSVMLGLSHPSVESRKHFHPYSSTLTLLRPSPNLLISTSSSSSSQTPTWMDQSSYQSLWAAKHHGLDPAKKVCQADLAGGKCGDAKCACNHLEMYEVKEADILNYIKSLFRPSQAELTSTLERGLELALEKHVTATGSKTPLSLDEAVEVASRWVGESGIRIVDDTIGGV